MSELAQNRAVTTGSSTADRIVLEGLTATGYHGVLAHEKRDGQQFAVDVVMEVDLAPAGRSDDLCDTVSYAAVADDVMALITGASLDLVEALAARVAEVVLRRELVEAVEVTVHKPDAPVGHPVRDVQVRLRRERRARVVLAIGSNLGESQRTLESAVREIGALRGVSVDAVSPLFDTDAQGGPDQPDYLNAVLLVTTCRAPGPLLDALQELETAHGRVRETRWGARTLDIDMIQYGDALRGTDVVSDDIQLTLPHPRAHERGFVLRPWHAVDPTAYLRVDGRPEQVSELLRSVDVSGVRPGQFWRPTW